MGWRESAYCFSIILLLIAAVATIRREKPRQVSIEGDFRFAVHSHADPRAGLDEIKTPARASQDAARVWLDATGSPLPFQSDEAILEFLREADVVAFKPLGKGSTNPYRVILERDGIRVRAIFRYVDTGDRERHVRRGNVRLTQRDSYLFEVAAYHLSRLMHLDTIPPVVLREIGGKQGSLQIWVENAMTELDKNTLGLQVPDQHRWIVQDQTMRIFDGLIHNIDRNQGNILYDSEWRMWYIDHTRAFHRASRVPEIDKIINCERRLWERLQRLSEDEIVDCLSPYLDLATIKCLVTRHKKLALHIQDLIDVKGEDTVLFD